LEHFAPAGANTVRALAALLDKIGPGVVLVHSPEGQQPHADAGQEQPRDRRLIIGWIGENVRGMRGGMSW
jgi:hypothetical protein